MYCMFDRRQSVSNIVRVQSPSLPLPSPLLSSYSPPFPSPPFPPPLRNSSLNPARGSGERCKLPQATVWSGAKPQLPTILVHFDGEGTLLVAFKMYGFKQQKTAFPYIL